MLPDCRLGGYYTKADGENIKMYPAADKNAAGFIVGKRKVSGFPEVFDAKGVELLEDTASSDIIILDEIGWMESSAGRFSSEILNILSSDKTVLGVIRLGCETELIRSIKSNPSVTLFTVTEENRDALVDEIVKLIKGDQLPLN